MSKSKKFIFDSLMIIEALIVFPKAIIQKKNLELMRLMKMDIRRSFNKYSNAKETKKKIKKIIQNGVKSKNIFILNVIRTRRPCPCGSHYQKLFRSHL